MPRKFRPPTTKRRKSRTSSIPYEFDGGNDPQPSADNGALDDDAPLLAVDVAEPPAEVEDRPLRESARTVGERHVSRDYGYVRGEVVRIVVIALLIIVAMGITAVLRA